MEVYVANLRKYNEGELFGAWFKLPMDPRDMHKKLNEVTCASHGRAPGEFVADEYAIHDFQETNFRLNEFENLFNLNLLATFEVNASEYEREAVEAYMDNIEDLSVLEMCNYFIQADDIPYYSYGYDGDTPEERYGRMYWNECCFELSRDQRNLVEDFIDFHEFGRYVSGDDYLGENGYLVGYADYPDEDKFSRKELIQLANELGWR